MIATAAKNAVKRILGPQNTARVTRARNFLTRREQLARYHILIDTTNACNLRCSFCPRNNQQMVQMKASDFDAIIAKSRKHIGSLQLSCAWEYSIARNAAEIVTILGNYRIPQTEILTNSNVLSDDLAEAVVKAGIDVDLFSIGETKKGTYERIRKGGNFEKVMGNIGKLNRLKKKHGSDRPRLGANLTLMRANITELPGFVDLAHESGIEEIRGRHLILNEGLDMDAETIRDKNMANAIIESASAKAAEHGVDFSIPLYTDNPGQPKSCRAPWNQLYISSNGDVSICPRIHRYDCIGNLINGSFEKVITSRKMKNLKDQFETGVFANSVCKICLANRESEVPIDQRF